MTTRWAHLPNAKHIDRVLSSLDAHPKIWETATRATKYESYKASMDIAYRLAVGKDRYVTWRIACDVAGRRNRAARDAITGLIAYDDSAHLLDSTPEEIKLLHALGHEYSIVFLPAVIALTNVNSHDVL